MSLDIKTDFLNFADDNTISTAKNNVAATHFTFKVFDVLLFDMVGWTLLLMESRFILDQMVNVIQ